jgi:hypothetical protein
MEHEPCSLLSDSKGPCNLTRANTILSGGNDPDSGEPSLKPEWGVFKDGSYLGGKLPLYMGALALPFLLVRQIVNILAATGRALHALRPAMLNHVGKAIVRVCEVNDSFLECLRGFHVLKIEELS